MEAVKERMLLKAATTATEQGMFDAVISSATVDREKDIVDPAGMVRALQKWVQTGKKIPLAWMHSTKAEDQIGYIDPASARVVGNEVHASGWIDQSTDVGKHAWRLVKTGTLGFSFGYLVLPGGSTKRTGGGRHLTGLDVFEVTATQIPMHNDTRVLGWKSQSVPAPAEDQSGGEDEDPADTLEAILELMQDFIDAEDDPQDVATMKAIAERLQALIDAEDAEGDKALLPAGGAWLFPEAELSAARNGEIKAVWTTAAVNDLPDSAFLYIEPGGGKDSGAKTAPRSLRHFPYRDQSGQVDLPHLRNALSRIPQSSLSQSIKDALSAKAQRILDNQKSVDATDQEHKSRSVDPLRAKADAVALEYVSDGESRRKPPHQKVVSRPAPELELDELRRRTRDETLIALSGVDEP